MKGKEGVGEQLELKRAGQAERGEACGQQQWQNHEEDQQQGFGQEQAQIGGHLYT